MGHIVYNYRTFVRRWRRINRKTVALKKRRHINVSQVQMYLIFLNMLYVQTAGADVILLLLLQ